MDKGGDSELLLYGIAGADAPSTEALAGVGGTRLQAISEEGLTALISAAPERASLTNPKVEDLLAFQGAIAKVHATADVLPARYGCVLAGEAELRAHLREKRLSYEEALGRIAGCVEMGVRIQLESRRDPAVGSLPRPTPTGGADYLRSRQAHHRRIQQAQDDVQRSGAEVAAAFADLARSSHTQQSSDGTSLSVSFLVPRASIPAFRARFAEHARSAASREFLLGPWPPFSFSSSDGNG